MRYRTGSTRGLPTTNRVLVLLRALPRGNDMAGAIEEMKTVKVYPLRSTDSWADPTWVEPDRAGRSRLHPGAVGGQPRPTGEVLHEVVDSEPPFEEFRALLR